MQLLEEFGEFLEEYRVVGIAVAFVISTASISFVQSIVENIIMPVVTYFVPSAGWKTATFAIGPIVIGWGAFLAALVNFAILVTLVFVAVRTLRKGKKAARR